MNRIKLTFISFMTIAMAVGCNAAPDVIDGTSGVMPLPEVGKGDNYISNNAREFLITGEAHATLPEGYAELDEAAAATALEAAVAARLGRVVSAVKTHVSNVIRQENGGSASEKDRWFIYVKRNAGESMAAEAMADGTVKFAFALELVGNMYLMSGLDPDVSGRRTFEVTVSSWDGTEPETVEAEIKGSESRDAFPKYNELFSDGVFDIAVHFGGDYNKDRHDIETAKWMVEHLLESGWTNTEVTGFDDLKIDSPEFTKSVRVEGRDIDVRVKVVHSDMVEPAEEDKLSESMKASMSKADVIFYSGHAGEGSGFILDYQPRHEIKAAELQNLDLPNKYQIYVLDGCRTYRTYVDDIMKNPAKTWDNTNIVTTVNTTPFGAGYTVIWEFLHWFTITNDNGDHFPLSWNTFLRGVNRDTKLLGGIHYGVHGVDNNPKLNPHAADGIACKPCQGDSECGAGGNLCLGYSAGAACGVACTTDTACPDGFRCARLNDDPDQFYIPKQCVKRDYLCVSK